MLKIFKFLFNFFGYFYQSKVEEKVFLLCLTEGLTLTVIQIVEKKYGTNQFLQ